MRIFTFIVLVLSMQGYQHAYAVTKEEIKDGLSHAIENCMLGSVQLTRHKGKSFSSLDTIECSHYTVGLKTNTYIDPGFDSPYANIINSRSYERPITFTSLLKYPPKNSLIKRFKEYSNGETTNYLSKNSYNDLMQYIYNKRLPYTVQVVEDLKVLNNKKGLVIDQTILVNFLKLDDAYNFLSLVLKEFYNTPITELKITNLME